MLTFIIVLVFCNLFAGFVPQYRDGALYIPSFIGLMIATGVACSLGVR